MRRVPPSLIAPPPPPPGLLPPPPLPPPPPTAVPRRPNASAAAAILPTRPRDLEPFIAIPPSPSRLQRPDRDQCRLMAPTQRVPSILSPRGGFEVACRRHRGNRVPVQ